MSIRASWCAASVIGLASLGASGPGAPLAPAHRTAQPDDPAAPPECVLILRDGRRLEGTLLERGPERVLLRVGQAEIGVETRDIDRLEILDPLIVRYRAMKQAVTDDDPDQRLAIVDWLMLRGAYRLAYEETLSILTGHPDHERALRQKAVLEAQIAVLDGASERGQTPDPPRAPRPRAPSIPLLTPEQINLIKVYEIDLRDPPRLSIKPDTIDRLIATYSASEYIPASREGKEALHLRKPAEILDILFRLRARELYSEITVHGHPGSMKRFRDDVQREWLSSFCATSDCHGGVEAGRLWLASRAPAGEPATYTNFLILDRFRLADGTPLINYDKPADSPLLQYALPETETSTPHPRTDPDRPWRGVIKDPTEARFRDAVEWIRAMYTPRPDYPIDFPPPDPVKAKEDLAREADSAEPAPPETP